MANRQTNKNPTPPTKENVITAVNKQGFNLEFKTQQTLLKFKDTASIFNFEKIELNKLYQTKGTTLELDVFASFSFKDEELGKGAFYIECKGSDKDTALFLVEMPESAYNKVPNTLRLALKANNILEGPVKIIYDSFSCHSNYKSPQPFFIHTGDFFKPSGKDYTPCSKKSDRNHLYTGVTQLQDLITFLERDDKKGFAHDITKTTKYSDNLIIFPLLVVKSDIYVVRYGEITDNETVYGPVPWVGYRSTLERGLVNLDDSDDPPSQKLPVFFNIVNIDHLEEFLNQINKNFQYTKRIDELKN